MLPDSMNSTSWFDLCQVTCWRLLVDVGVALVAVACDARSSRFAVVCVKAHGYIAAASPLPPHTTWTVTPATLEALQHKACLTCLSLAILEVRLLLVVLIVKKTKFALLELSELYFTTGGVHVLLIDLFNFLFLFFLACQIKTLLELVGSSFWKQTFTDSGWHYIEEKVCKKSVCQFNQWISKLTSQTNSDFK